MNWEAEATLLAVRPHGESAAIIEVLSRAHGRYAGLVHGGNGRRMRPVLQIGNRLFVRWRARLAEHLGNCTVEPVAARAVHAMSDPLQLAALDCACTLARCLPERVAYPRCADMLETLLNVLDNPDLWPITFIRYELTLLEEMGFGLDLTSCAATGTTDRLSHISPRSGRAVSAKAAEPYADRLFPMPDFFRNMAGSASPQDIRAGFEITGYFLSTRLYHALERKLPDNRARMLELLFRHFALPNPDRLPS